MLGHELRWQQGFDCQGLWVEVEVEKELGFKTKRQIEDYGVANFVNKCKERVYRFAGLITQQSQRMGYWMDWENSYYTLSDQNNYSIWGFLKLCHERGWLYRGHDVMPWCPRWHRALRARDRQRRLCRCHPSGAHRRLPAAGSPGRGPAGLDDHALDAAGQCRGGGSPELVYVRVARIIPRPTTNDWTTEQDDSVKFWLTKRLFP